MGQIGNILTGARSNNSSGGGGGVGKVQAGNGLSLDPASTVPLPIVVFGDDGGGEAALSSNRHLQLDNFDIFFEDIAGNIKLVLDQGFFGAENGANFRFNNDGTQQFPFNAQGSYAGNQRVLNQNNLADASAASSFDARNDLNKTLQFINFSSIADPPFVPNSGMIRSNTSKLIFHNDAGEFFFGYTPAFDAPNVSLKSFSSGNWVFQKDQSFSAIADDGNALQVLQTQSLHGSTPTYKVYEDADNTIFSTMTPESFYVQDSGAADFGSLSPADLTLSDPVFENVITSQQMQIQNFSTNDIFNVSTTIANFINGADPNINSNWTASAINFFSDINTPITKSNLQAVGLTVDVVATGAQTFVGADFIQLFDGVSSTVNVNPDNINMSDGTDQSFIGFNYGKIGGALAALPFSTFDIYGSFATLNPVTGLLDSEWQLGNKTAGAAVLDAANFIPITINGVSLKLALVV